jgi:DNA-binding winged helix-turn-helix (wHTH) protein
MNDRRNSESKDILAFGPFSLFAAERLLKEGNEPIPLGGRALDILIALAERAGEVVTHKELMSTVWPDVTVEEANLRFQMAALRKALGDGRDGARYVSNVAGRGYCFVAPVTRSSAKQPVPVTRIATTERVQSCRRDSREWSAAMILFERWRSNFKRGASSASSVLAVSAKQPLQSRSLIR